MIKFLLYLFMDFVISFLKLLLFWEGIGHDFIDLLLIYSVVDLFSIFANPFLLSGLQYTYYLSLYFFTIIIIFFVTHLSFCLCVCVCLHKLVNGTENGPRENNFRSSSA